MERKNELRIMENKELKTAREIEIYEEKTIFTNIEEKMIFCSIEEKTIYSAREI
jgi:hypothetical protein